MHVGCRKIFLLPALAAIVFAAGCNRFRSKPPEEYVYVLQKQAYLRDHVAAVSNHTGTVVNGEKLAVLEHGRRFVRVRTDKGETGWLEERYTTTAATFDAFDKLKESEIGKPVVATGVVRDEVFMHLTPGRDTDHLFLLEEGDKVRLLQRASMPKPLPPGAVPPKPAVAQAARPRTAGEATPRKRHAGPAAVEGEPAVPMEDWWLVRDGQGRVGWVLGRRFDVDIPDAIAGYSEGQRFVGAYQLTTVNDPASGMPNGLVPVWLAVLVPYKDGLPYDFNQVRVFGWNRERHRYETSYRERDLWGYLPVKIDVQQFPNVKEPEPSFAFRNEPDKDTVINPDTGMAAPPHPDVRTYRMEGAIVRRVVPEQPKSANPAPAIRGKHEPKREPKLAAHTHHR